MKYILERAIQTHIDDMEKSYRQKINNMTEIELEMVKDIQFKENKLND